MTRIPQLSVIVPAYNEEFELPKTLAALFPALRAAGYSFEVIVVDDHSTDRTAAIAQEAGARVLTVSLRQISAVRNVGAKAAQGDFLLFVDADTRISETVIRGAVETMQKGAVGGGAWVRFEPPISPMIAAVIEVFDFFYMRVCRWAAGCFLFARRADFQAVGGFDQTLYASEEIDLSRRLKKRGPFILLSHPVHTSARKARMYSLTWPIRIIGRLLLKGRKVLETREGLDVWYSDKREKH